ncbi:MAG: DNA-binding protein [Burkholderia sp.]
MTEESLFSSAHSALVFAFNFSGQCYDRPMMNRLAQPAVGNGKGLSGLDGAAQAGMIRAKLRTLGRLHENILIARTAPKTIPCDCGSPCCAGHRTNLEWFDAAGYLTEHAKGALAGCFAHYRLRSAIIQKYFGVKISMVEIADDCEVSRTTANDHNAKVVKLLKAEESKAWAAIEDKFQAAGIVGEMQNA